MMTDIEKFDRAVWEYLLEISDKIVYAPTQTALTLMTKREKFSDKKPWNFLSFYREPQFEVDWERMNNPGVITGDNVHVVADENGKRHARYVQSVPLDLTYNVNIWASKSVEALEIATKLFSKVFMDGPDQVLIVPINPDGEPGRFHINDVSWVDNSDIERESEIGKIYRHTIQFTVDARVLLVRDVKTTQFYPEGVPVNIYE